MMRLKQCCIVSWYALLFTNYVKWGKNLRHSLTPSNNPHPETKEEEKIYFFIFCHLGNFFLAARDHSLGEFTQPLFKCVGARR